VGSLTNVPAAFPIADERRSDLSPFSRRSSGFIYEAGPGDTPGRRGDLGSRRDGSRAPFLELLYSARDRSRTVHATIHRRSHPARDPELLRARGLYRDPPAIPKEEGAAGGAPPTIVETTTQLWAARPDRLRWEPVVRGYGPDELASVVVKQGEVFWERSGDGDLHTNENREPLR
jgi:hypothetical protein